MKIFSKIFNNRLNKIIQAQNDREKMNRAAFEFLSSLGFSLPEIRKALVVLNGVNICELAKEDGISLATMYNTMKGTRESPKAKEILAGTLGLEQEDLFPRRVAAGGG